MHVNVTGTILTASSSFLFLQQVNLTTRISRPWSGIKLLTDVHAPVGTEVNVIGDVNELNGSTTIVEIRALTPTGSTFNLPRPPVISTSALGSACDFEAESYESLVVRVINVTLWATEDLLLQNLIAIDDGSGPAYVSGNMFDLRTEVQAALGFDIITAYARVTEISGLLDFDGDKNVLVPRIKDDIEGIEFVGFVPTPAPTAKSPGLSRESGPSLFGQPLSVASFLAGTTLGFACILLQRLVSSMSKGRRTAKGRRRVLDADNLSSTAAARVRRRELSAPTSRKSIVDKREESTPEPLDQQKEDGTREAESASSSRDQSNNYAESNECRQGSAASVNRLRDCARKIIDVQRRQKREADAFERHIRVERLRELKKLPPSIRGETWGNEALFEELAKVKELHERKMDSVRMLYDTKRFICTVRSNTP